MACQIYFFRPKIRKELRRRRTIGRQKIDSKLPSLEEGPPSHKKKSEDDLQIGKYSNEDLDSWAELIKAGVCTYEGIASGLSSVSRDHCTRGTYI